MKKYFLVVAFLAGCGKLQAAQEVSYSVVSSTAIKKTVILTGQDLQNEKDQIQFQINAYQTYINNNPTTALQNLLSLLQSLLAILNQAN